MPAECLQLFGSSTACDVTGCITLIVNCGEMGQVRSDLSQIDTLSALIGFALASVAAVTWSRLNRRSADREPRYYGLFDRAPIGLLEFDISRTLAILRRLAEQHGDYRRPLAEDSALIYRVIREDPLLAVNRRALEIFNVRDAATYAANLHVMMGTPSAGRAIAEAASRFAEGISEFRAEVIARRFDTRGEFPAIVTMTVLPRTTRLLIAVEDISELREADRQRGETEERLRRAIDGSLDAVFLLQSIESNGQVVDFEHIDVNQPGLDLLHLTRDELIGSRLVRDFPPLAERYFDLFRHTAETGETAEVEVEIPESMASPGWYWWHVVPMPGGVAVFSRCVTHRHQAARALERAVEERTAELTRALRVKDRFLANMSHELRTPLNSVLMLAESLAEPHLGTFTEHQERCLKHIEASGKHLLQLINDVLDLARLDAGADRLVVRSVSVECVCNSAVSLVRELANRKSQTLRVSTELAPGRICADDRRLRQILVNLLSNAIKFTPAAGQIDLIAARDGSMAQFIVTDNGIGIPEDTVSRLFRPFVQADESLDRKYEGTGLGLTLAKQLAELHGGTVGVDSAVGKGSTFCVRLPMNTGTDDWPSGTECPDAGWPNGHSDVATTASRRPHLLLVDDNEITRDTVGLWFESRGYSVEHASDGYDALEKALGSARPFDVLLMDIQLPGLDGLEVARRLRGEPRTRSTPIVALTALAMEGDRDRCIEAGATEYVTKPVVLRELEDVVAGLLRR